MSNTEELLDWWSDYPAKLMIATKVNQEVGYDQPDAKRKQAYSEIKNQLLDYDFNRSNKQVKEKHQ